MTTQHYVESINSRFKLDNATEHTFRGDLAQLIETLVPDIVATNEPKRQKCGAPDYILTRKEIPIGFIEAKDIGDKDLDGTKKTGNKEQFDRYKASLENLIFTDYINFHLYRNGEFVTKISIAEVMGNQIKALPENFPIFENLIKDFCIYVGQTIKSPKKLAEMMAGKARLLADIIANALMSDENSSSNSTLREQMEAFKEILIHDITPKAFADVYAQTIAYGMFAARLHDATLPTFSRQEAAELIPKSNPFLRKLFGYIAGPDLDDRIKWIVDSLVDIFLACNVEEILKDYGKSTKMENPIIHFYETFLSEYDPKLRKARGVWYTPAPVVSFIVRAVDDILKTEFDLPQGLADTSKTKITLDTQNFNRKKQKYETVEQEVHKVQILDPATGTGTFLAEVVKHVHQKFAGQQGIWSNYVEKHLIPRLNGFELLMASYAMAHLQMDLLLKDTGYKATSDERLKIYLTNSLEESHPDTNTLFASWLSDEANEANRVKRDTPVMVILGNPPYSGESANKGEWIMKLMEDYKKEPGGKEKLKEQNSKFINDDYVKFIRYGQHFIEKNGSGILAFINPHGFLDNPTFRGMRWSLLKTYDKIYTIDLHGNSKKKEVSPDGSPDVNVFDIMQGVSINLFIKTGKKNETELGHVFHYDLFGKRDVKYNFLIENSLKEIDFKLLPNIAPNYFFVNKDFGVQEEYDEGFYIPEIFKINSLGIQTHRDSFVIDEDNDLLRDRIKMFFDKNISNDTIKNKFELNENSDWQLEKQRKGIFNDKNIVQISYRPFDNRFMYYDKLIVDRLRDKVSSNFQSDNKNICLVVPRQCISDWRYSFISKNMIESNLTGTAGRFGSGNFFPLYRYQKPINKVIINNQPERVPNLNMEIVEKIAKDLGLHFSPERPDYSKQTEETNQFYPEDILDYIYAVLHSPSYREKYKEFLKIDFPRVPYPNDAKTFWKLVELGRQIREIHLLESPVVEKFITQYPISGNNEVTKLYFEENYEIVDGDTTINLDPVYPMGRVYINETQYFQQVPKTAWEFYIGGYQPAQKWLKDRKGRTLDFEDILHYQKIIVALFETDRLMKEVDNVISF